MRTLQLAIINLCPSIVVSRTHPDLIRRLFEIEVPEIYDGLVEIKSIAREPGDRSKVAVASREPNLDPVGACVGPKGSRVRMVVEGLRNERVDVIQWNEDPAVYVANAQASVQPQKANSPILTRLRLQQEQMRCRERPNPDALPPWLHKGMIPRQHSPRQLRQEQTSGLQRPARLQRDRNRGNAIAEHCFC